jgi:hypothetical protein
MKIASESWAGRVSVLLFLFFFAQKGRNLRFVRYENSLLFTAYSHSCRPSFTSRR